MSLLFLDSFDHYTVTGEKWDAQFYGNNIIPTQAQGRFTPGALKLKGYAGIGWWAKSIDDSSEVIAGFAWNNLNADTYPGIFSLIDNSGSPSTSSKAILQIDAGTGIATLTYNGNGISSPATTFTGSAWQHVEMRVLMHSTAGELEIRRNGVQVAIGTGLNTIYPGATALSSFRVEVTSNSQEHYIDDLYILNTEGTVNNTFVGDSRITVLRPGANGVVNQFNPVGADSNYEAVDETIHDQGTTYVQSGTVSAQETYDNVSFNDLGVTPGTIFGVQTVNAVVKTDAGEVDYLDQMIVGGTAYDNGTDVIATSGTYQMTCFIRDTDPSDDGTWTEAKVAAVGSGLKITYVEGAV
jgi:hypothetical protein